LSTKIFLKFYYLPNILKYFRKNQIEDDEGRTCLQPLLEAEQDRLLLWQMRRNRDDENQLMKDVPGWVTGTWFGEPLFKTLPNMEKWVQPTYAEVYAHTRMRDLNKHMHDRSYLP
jgi:NADH dehydrogenase (ubiquinone) 1 alpha subcomplex subunit 13